MPSYSWNGDKQIWTKTCSCCQIEFDGVKDEQESREIFLKTFSPNNGRSDAADRLQSRCYICNSHRRYYIGANLEELRDMLQEQEGCCAICEVPIFLDRGAPNPANIDHDHKTGEIRDLLCGNCNRGIGLFFDNPDLLEAAAKYIHRHMVKCDG